MIQVRMLEAPTAHFEAELNELLAEGWELGGHVHYHTVGDKVICTQQLILDVPRPSDLLEELTMAGILRGVVPPSTGTYGDPTGTFNDPNLYGNDSAFGKLMDDLKTAGEDSEDDDDSKQ